MDDVTRLIIEVSFLDLASGAIEKLGMDVDGLGSKFGVAGTAAGILGTAVAALGVTAAVGIGAAVDAATKLQDTIANVQVNTGATADDMERFKNNAQDLQSTVGANMDQMAAGFRQAFDVTKNVNIALAENTVATRDAAAAHGDAGQFTNALAVAMHEYQLDLDKATGQQLDFNDAMQQSQVTMGMLVMGARDANATLPQFTEFLSRASVEAAQMGVPLQDVEAGLASMSRHGYSIDQGATQLRGIFSHIQRQPTKAEFAELQKIDQGTEQALAQKYGTTDISQYSPEDQALFSQGQDQVVTEAMGTTKTIKAQPGLHVNQAEQDFNAQGIAAKGLTGILADLTKQYDLLGYNDEQRSQSAGQLVTAQRGGIGLGMLLTKANADYNTILGDVSDTTKDAALNDEILATQQKTLTGQLADLRGEAQTFLQIIGAPMTNALTGWASSITNGIKPVLAQLPDLMTQGAAIMAGRGQRTRINTGASPQDVKDGATQFEDISPVEKAFDTLTHGIVIARDTVKTFFEALGGGWKDSDQVVGVTRAFGIMGTIIHETVIPALEAIGKLMVDVVFPTLLKLGSIFANDWLPAVQRFYEGFANGWKTGVTSFSSGFATVGAVVANVVKTASEDVGNFFKGFSDGWSTGVTSFSDGWQAAGAKVAGFVHGTIIPALQALGDWIKNTGLPAVQSLWDRIGGWQGVWANISKDLNAFRDAFNQIRTAITETVTWVNNHRTATENLGKVLLSVAIAIGGYRIAMSLVEVSTKGVAAATTAWGTATTVTKAIVTGFDLLPTAIGVAALEIKEGAVTLATKAWGVATGVTKAIVEGFDLAVVAVGVALIEAREIAVATATKVWAGAQLALTAAYEVFDIVKLTAAFALFEVQEIAINVATKAWAAAQWLLNVAMDANPVGLVVAAIAALVAGVILAYQHNEKFRDIVNELWAKMKEFGSWLAQEWPVFIKKVGDMFDWLGTKANEWFGPGGKVGSFFDWLGTKANGFKDGFMDIFGAGGKIATAISDVGTTANDWFGPGGKIGQFFDNVGTKAHDLWKKVTDEFTNVKNDLGAIWDKVQQKFRDMNDTIVDAVLSPFRAIRDAIGDIMNAFKDKMATPFNIAAKGITAFIGGIRDAVSWVADKLHIDIGMKGDFPGVPQFASGGKTPGGAFIAGEGGKELVVAPEGSQVFTAQETINIFKAINGGKSPQGAPIGDSGFLGMGAGPWDKVTSVVGDLAGDVAGGVRDFIANGAQKVLDLAMSAVHVPKLGGDGIFSGIGSGIMSTVKDIAIKGIQAIMDGVKSALPAPVAASGVMGTPADYPGGNAIVDMAERTPGVYMWCEKFVGDVFQRLGLQYFRAADAETHSNMQPLSGGTPPVGAVVFYPWDGVGHVNIAGPGGSSFGTVPEGTGWRGPGFFGPAKGWTTNPRAEGGMIPETVIGVGLSSGQTYSFGEDGPEYVVPMGPGMGAGSPQGITYNVRAHTVAAHTATNAYGTTYNVAAHQVAAHTATRSQASLSSQRATAQGTETLTDGNTSAASPSAISGTTNTLIDATNALVTAFQSAVTAVQSFVESLHGSVQDTTSAITATTVANGQATVAAQSSTMQGVVDVTANGGQAVVDATSSTQQTMLDAARAHNDDLLTNQSSANDASVKNTQTYTRTLGTIQGTDYTRRLGDATDYTRRLGTITTASNDAQTTAAQTTGAKIVATDGTTNEALVTGHQRLGQTLQKVQSDTNTAIVASVSKTFTDIVAITATGAQTVDAQMAEMDRVYKALTSKGSTASVSGAHPNTSVSNGPTPSPYDIVQKALGGPASSAGSPYNIIAHALGISGYADGGVLNEPIIGFGKSGRAYTLAERGREYVLNEDQMSGLRGGGSGSDGIQIGQLHVHVAGSVLTDESLTMAVYNGLQRMKRRNGVLNLS